jgi:hypothetical protein
VITLVSWLALFVVVLWIATRAPHPDELDDLDRIRRERAIRAAQKELDR